MTPQRISKKFILYFFILLLLSTPFNKKLSELNFNKGFSFEISSLSDFNDAEIIDDLSNFKNENLFLLNKEKIIKIIKKYKSIEGYNLYKNYPSKIIIDLKKTKLLAITKKEGVNFYIGSNGNLIKIKDNHSDLPVVFGNVDIAEFLKLKDLIDNSIFDFQNVENLYYFKSKRWDIETKDGLLIKLSQDNLVKSFELFINILNKKDLQNINTIDLRQNNQIILNG